MKELVKAGADVNVANPWTGDTPLHLVARKREPGAVQCAEALVKAGASVDAVNKASRTPLDEATETSNTEMRSLLEDYVAIKVFVKIN